MTKGRKKVLAISGSTRKNSTNEKILKVIEELYEDRLDVDIYDGVDSIPHFNPDLDKEDPPEIVKDFRTRIQSSDGVIFCTPEYVFSLPGSLKNAIEWTVSTTVFTDKPVAIIVASASGAKAFESLSLVMETLQSNISEQSKLLINGAKGKVGQDGEITDPETLEKIEHLVRSFIKSMDKAEPVV